MTAIVTYIDYLQKQNADDLAFYPLTALEKAIEDNSIITCTDNDDPAGYIWHGPCVSGKDTVIYQACVDYDSRRRHLGWEMVKELINMCNTSGATGIRLRCASSSESNEFWRLIGFYCTKISASGTRRRREINHWRTDIQTPLFTVEHIEPSSAPIDDALYHKNYRTKTQKLPSKFSRTHY